MNEKTSDEDVRFYEICPQRGVLCRKLQNGFALGSPSRLSAAIMATPLLLASQPSQPLPSQSRKPQKNFDSKGLQQAQPIYRMYFVMFNNYSIRSHNADQNNDTEQ